jgi:branched-chain amino acid transport system permease protein
LPECLTSGFWPHTFDGLVLGSIYAMIALGYTLVYGVLQLINFAHSEVFMVGSFFGVYTLVFGVEKLGVDVPSSGPVLWLVLLAALVAAMLASGMLAVGLERIAYRPLRRRGAPRLAFLITAIGASLFLSNLWLVRIPIIDVTLGGAGPVFFPDVLEKQRIMTIFSYGVSNTALMIVVTMIVMYVLLDRFVTTTRIGKGIRAVAQDPETAAMMGVDINRVITITFLTGGILAGAAGMLYGLHFGQAQFNIGFIPGIKAFTAAVLGGIGNVRGALLGGILLGLIENLGVTCLATHWQDVISFLVLVGVLMFRPTGILGERVRA